MKIKLTTKKYIENNSSPYFIAEIGSNHNGDMELGKKLIYLAKKSGADCVKFQSWNKNSIFSKVKYKENYFLKDDYRNRKDTNLEDIVDKYAISEEELFTMYKYAKKLKIDFTSTPFSKKEVDFLSDELDVPFIKIASMDLNNYQFLDYIARKNKPIILSIGMGSLQELDKAIETIERAGNNKIIILHCLAIYPAPDKNINLSRIDTLKNIYPYPVGYSDHSLGTSVSIGAVAKGAVVIEKHFTIDKNMEGWDHKISSDYIEMKSLITECKRVNLALGDNRIIRTEPDERVKEFRRSIVAAKNITKGEKFSKDMFDFKRPGTGLEPNMAEFIIGRKSKRNISYDEIIKPDDF